MTNNESATLSIIIPTFNRCNFVKKNVESLLPQLRKYPSKVELIITDNASTDATQQVLEPIVRSCSNIKYFRQDQNIGAHKNFYFGISKATKAYSILLGDDDLLAPYFCDTIFSLLEENPDVALIHFNYLQASSRSDRIIVFENHWDTNGFVHKYDKGQDFITAFWDIPSFITSNVFQTSLYLDSLKENLHPDCYGFDWLLVLYFSIVNQPCLAYYMPLAFQYCNGEYYDSQWPLYALVGKANLFKYLDAAVPGCYLKWNQYIRKDRKRYLRTIFKCRKNRLLFSAHRNEFRLHFANNIERICFDLSTSYPKPLAGVAYFGIRFYLLLLKAVPTIIQLK